MTKESAIKYLRQIYPNGGHCWLDSQRIEAIEMAITALSHLSLPSNLDEAAEETSQSACSAPTAAGFAIRSFFKRGFKSGAGWMAERDKEKIEQAFFSGYDECEERMKKEFEKMAMAGEVNNTGYPTTIQLHTFDSSLKNGDKVNIIIMKQEQK